MSLFWNEIHEIPIESFDVKIGHAQDAEGGTGCTVVLRESGMAAAVEVRGGGPASRETQLLNPLAAAERVHAILLGGGSAFGLEAGCGVAKELEARGIGFPTAYGTVPLVCQSDIYDLGVGSAQSRPDQAMGRAACIDAFTRTKVGEGNIGVGTGATVGKTCGAARMMKAGLGTYAVQLGELKVGVLAVANALGDVYDWRDGKKLAGLRGEDGIGFADGEQALCARLMQAASSTLYTENTTLCIVLTNADLDKRQLMRVAAAGHNGLARTIRPVHTSADGDTVYAAATGGCTADLDLVATLASTVTAEAICRAVTHTVSAYGIPAAGDKTVE